MEPDPKPLRHSKTAWAAWITAIAAALNGATDYVQDARILSWVMVGQAVLFLLLRVVTDRPIE